MGTFGSILKLEMRKHLAALLFRLCYGSSHLTATLSARLVAVKVEALVCLTVTGAAGLVTPLASGTRKVCPVDTHTHMHARFR